MHNFDVGQTVTRAAQALGVGTLDFLAISHANFDHYSGAATVLEDLPTGRLLLNPYFAASAAENPAVRQFLDLLPLELPPRSVLRAGDRLMVGEAAIEILWPPAELDESWRPNDRSLVLRIEAHGRSVLIPGDIERAALRSLLDSHSRGEIDLKADVLIAPHHGSVVPMDTAAFYAAVSPEVVIISTGRERPKLVGLVRETLGDAVQLLGTDEVGAVRVCITPAGELRAETPFAPTAK
jgi:competence protein ComEC